MCVCKECGRVKGEDGPGNSLFRRACSQYVIASRRIFSRNTYVHASLSRVRRSVLCGRSGCTNETNETNLEYTPGFFIYKTADPLAASTPCKTTDGWLGYTLDVIAARVRGKGVMWSGAVQNRVG